jgi:hypothetical protein
MQEHDCSGLPSLAVQFPGPFTYHDVVVNEWKVPFLTAQMVGEDGIRLVLDQRLAVDLTVADAERFVPFVADAIAVALGYPSHPYGDTSYERSPAPRPVRANVIAWTGAQETEPDR